MNGEHAFNPRTLDAANLPRFIQELKHHFHRIESEVEDLEGRARRAPALTELASRAEALRADAARMRSESELEELSPSLRRLELDAEALASTLHAPEDEEDLEPRLEKVRTSLESLRAMAARIPEVANLLDLSGMDLDVEPPSLPELVDPSVFEKRDIQIRRPERPWQGPGLSSSRSRLTPTIEDGQEVLVPDERIGKVRVRLLDSGGQPAARASFLVVATSRETEREITLAQGTTNQYGYASLNLSHIRSKDLSGLAVELVGRDKEKEGSDDPKERLRYDIASDHFRTHRDLALPHVLKVDPAVLLDRLNGTPGPSIEAPDARDIEHSPESFGFETELVDGNCCIKPSPEVAVREYFFRQLVRIDDPELATNRDPFKRSDVTAPIPFGAEDRSPYSVTGGNLVLGKSVLYKQSWQPVKQGLGRLLYSLALAPCESVNLAVIDWSRSERSTRREASQYSERMEHELRRDRTIDELVESTLTETLSGSSATEQEAEAGSNASGWEIAAGAAAGFLAGGPAGAAVGALGVSLLSPNSATSSGGTTTSSQEGYRHLVGETSQQLSDRVSQRAASFRSQRSTVVTTSYQRESERIRTRTVRNHNKNHAMTVQYHQVLAHYRVVTEVHKEQDIVLIPYEVDRDLFDTLPSFQKFKNQPSRPITRFLLRHRRMLERMVPRRFRSAFASLSRLLNCRDVYQLEDPYATCSRWRIDLDQSWRPSLRLSVETHSGSSVQLHPTRRRGASVFESSPVRLDEIESLKISFDPSIAADEAAESAARQLRKMPFITDEAADEIAKSMMSKQLTYKIDRCSVRARTDRSRFVSAARYYPVDVEDPEATLDEGNPVVSLQLDPPDLTQAFEAWQNRQHRDYCLLQELIAHVQEDPMRYLRAIWLAENPDRRALRLDRLKFDGEPLMSQIQNQPLGAFGNYVAFPLMEEGRRVKATAPALEVEERFVSLPTPGVFAEVYLSCCNATEKRDLTRVVDADTGCQVNAPEITGITPGSRRSQPDTAPTSFPTPMVNVQSAPGAPSPTGLSSAMGVLSTPNLFRDVTFGAQTVEAARTLAQQALVTSGEKQKALLDTLVSLVETGVAAAGAAAGMPTGLGGGSGRSGTSSSTAVPSGDGKSATEAAQATLRKALGAAAGESVRSADPVRTYDQQQNIERAHRSGALSDEGRGTATSNLLGDTGAEGPPLAGAVAGPGGRPVSGGFPIAGDDPLDADTIVSHPFFKLPKESTLREFFPGTEPVEDRIGEEERQRATTRGYWFTASILHRASPDAAVMAPIPLLTYLIFDFPVGESGITSEELQPLRSLLERRAQALRDRNLQLQIDIMGTTDETGPDEVNQALRVQRAQRVAELLGSTGYRIRYIGPSDSAIAPETNELGRALNRSVTVHESVEQLGGTSIRRMPDDIEDIKRRTREKLQEQADAGDLDADIGLCVMDIYDQRTGQLSVLMKGMVREYYNEYVPDLARRVDNPLYRADLFFTDGRAEMDHTLTFAPNAALATDIEKAADDFVLTIKVLAAATYEGINLHIQFSEMDRGDSTVDPWDMMTREIQKRVDNNNSVYGKCFDKFKDALDTSPDLNF